jgi:hypothetical protein
LSLNSKKKKKKKNKQTNKQTNKPTNKQAYVFKIFLYEGVGSFLRSSFFKKKKVVCFEKFDSGGPGGSYI